MSTAAQPGTTKVERVVVRCTPEEKRLIDNRAAELGISSAALLRIGWRYIPEAAR
jgi:uncharacterized protein (DUF1778 family)